MTNETQTEPPLLSLTDVAAGTGMSMNAVRRWAACGALPTIQIVPKASGSLILGIWMPSYDPAGMDKAFTGVRDPVEWDRQVFVRPVERLASCGLSVRTATTV